MTDTDIQNVLNGDADAFRFIVREHKDNAYTLAISVVKDEALARDVVQVAFIKAYTQLGTFRKESGFSTWFYRIVINEAFNRQTKEKKKPVALETVSPDEPGVEEIDAVFSKMEQDDQQNYINEALMRLPANYSLALRLFYLNEFSLDEITQITGWTNANTRVLLYRARKEIKQVLTGLLNINKEDLY
jgi:RNA polymerase sigma factor (sigma-70 family)